MSFIKILNSIFFFFFADVTEDELKAFKTVGKLVVAGHELFENEVKVCQNLICVYYKAFCSKKYFEDVK